ALWGLWASSFGAAPWLAVRFQRVAACRPRAVHDDAQSRQILAFVPWPDVRFGSKADIRAAKSHARFTPKSGIDHGSHSDPRAKKETAWWRSLGNTGQALSSSGSCLGAGLQKGKEIGISNLCMRGYHSVRQALVGF